MLQKLKHLFIVFKYSKYTNTVTPEQAGSLNILNVLRLGRLLRLGQRRMELEQHKLVVVELLLRMLELVVEHKLVVVVGHR